MLRSVLGVHISSPIRLAGLEAVLQPLQEDKVILRRGTDGAGILQTVNADVGLKALPIDQIPVDTEAELVGVAVEGRHVLWRIDVVEEDARLVPLNPGVASQQFPSAPAAAGFLRLGSKYGVLDPWSAVFRPLFSGDQEGRGGAPSLVSDGREIGNPSPPSVKVPTPVRSKNAWTYSSRKPQGPFK